MTRSTLSPLFAEAAQLVDRITARIGLLRRQATLAEARGEDLDAAELTEQASDLEYHLDELRGEIGRDSWEVVLCGLEVLAGVREAA